ncbi:MAG: Cell division protein FtsI, partial [Myxococcaceae bacterium]|nr:Cell division protein FtsI [Myxococcaceae bacterium]
MGMLCGLMGLGLGGFVSSAYRVQVEDGPTWRETAEKQRQRRMHIEPKRGTIFDRNGTALAVSVEVPSLSVDVVEMIRGAEGAEAQDALLKDAALRLGAALTLPADELHAKLATRKRFLWIKRRISGDEAAAVRDLADAKKQPRPIKGLNVEGEGHRYYPGRELLGPVIGFVAPDGEGKDGLELSLDEELRGHVEEVSGLRDRSGRLIFS